MLSNKNRKLIKKLFYEDQVDRSSIAFRKYSDRKRLGIIGRRDKKRISILEKILGKNPKLHGLDYFRAGIIFQHGQTIELIKKAKKCAKKSSNLGYEPGRWLYAAATDRVLVMRGKSQKFGTQFKKTKEGWELCPIMANTTDSERKKYHVAPLHKIKKVVSLLNRETGKSGFPKVTIGLTKRR